MFNLLAGKDYAKSFYSVDIFDSEADWTFSGQGEREKKKMAGSLQKGDRVCLFCIALEVSQRIKG